MTDPLLRSAGPAGPVLATACVVAGGPWFAHGLRTARARRALRALPESPATRMHPGALHVKGRVVLESPLFAPLSGRSCARFELQVLDAPGLSVGRVAEERAFLLELESAVARVETGAAWTLGVTEERSFASSSELSTNVSALLDRSPELRWIKARGGPMRIVERALFAGAEAHVIGRGLRGATQWREHVELQRTGTDDAAWEPPAAEAVDEWHIGPHHDLEHSIVSDRPLDPRRLAPALWRAHGALLGPALALAGLVELAEATGRALGAGSGS